MASARDDGADTSNSGNVQTSAGAPLLPLAASGPNDGVGVYGAPSADEVGLDAAGALAATGPGAASASGAAKAPATNVAGRSPSKHRRLAALDIMRGFTMAGMILADDVNDSVGPVHGYWQHLNHSPWNDITYADFIMPWFLFYVGTAMAFSLRRYKTDPAARRDGTKKAAIRAAKLYALGVIIQGGGLPSDYTYGYNLAVLRLCGILNRIAFAYLVVALGELWLPKLKATGLRAWPHVQHLVIHSWQWAVAVGTTALYLLLTFFTHVPSWESHWGYDNVTNSRVMLAEPFTVECDVSGYTETPKCAANGYWDRALFGQKRLGAWMSTRLPECSTCSPGPCTPPPSAYGDGENNWCFAHMYDPEGALATVATVASCWLGLHFGHVLMNKSLAGDRARLTHWAGSTVVLIALGLIIHFAGFKMNKQLWSTSYVCFMAGTCGLGLCLMYVLVDSDMLAGGRVSKWSRFLLDPIRAMGLNAILLFFWHGPAQDLINIVYWSEPVVGDGYAGKPEDHAFAGVHGWLTQSVLLPLTGHDPAAAYMLYCWVKIACFMLGMWLCMRRGYFWKV